MNVGSGLYALGSLIGHLLSISLGYILVIYLPVFTDEYEARHVLANLAHGQTQLMQSNFVVSNQCQLYVQCSLSQD